MFIKELLEENNNPNKCLSKSMANQKSFYPKRILPHSATRDNYLLYKIVNPPIPSLILLIIFPLV